MIFLSGGNPALEPLRARSIDAYAEYYLPYRGILSLGVFHKEIDDPIFILSILSDLNMPKY